MSVQPAYGSQPIGFGPVVVSAANTNRDGTGTIVQIAVGRGPGTRIERVHIHASVTTAAGVIGIYKKASGLARNADGTFASYTAPTWRLIAEVAVTVATPSTTVAAFEAEWVPTDGHTLADGEQLGAATQIANSFNVEAIGAHL